MKKIFIIFAAMAAVLSSCQKSELESVSVNDGKYIVLNISVSNPGADDTKALIKEGWEENDQIKIWFDANTGDTPDLVIKYNGTKWIQNTGASVSGNTPLTGTGKYAKALYNGTVKVASKDNYTFENSTLSFSIENWKFLTEVQVVVRELDKDKAGSYTLSCDKFTPLASTGNGYTVGSDAITASTGTKGDAVTGISNADGVAFVFATAEYSSTAADYKFTLKDNTSGSEVTKVYKPNVAIAAKEGKSSIKALTIANNKFKSPVPDGFVDMGVKNASGEPVYWRTMNLGATTVAENTGTCYGNLYSWGEVATKLDYSPGKYTDEAKAINNTTHPWDKTMHDAAYKESDGAWRMPTSAEFQALYNACVGPQGYDKTTKPTGKPTNKGVYWCDNYNGVAGCLFYNGTNELFFPAAGRSDSDSRTKAGSYGRYWSSTWCSPVNAFYLLFSDSNVTPQSNNTRSSGYSVRPVSE